MDIEQFLMVPGQTFSNMARGSTYDELYEKINNLIPLLNQYYKEHSNKDLDENINDLIDDYNNLVDVLFAPRKGRKIDKKMKQKFENLSGKLYDGYKFKNKHLTEKPNYDEQPNLALNILGVSGSTKKAREDKVKFEVEQKRLAEEKAEKLRKDIEERKIKVEKEKEELKKIATELGFVDNINFNDKSFNEMLDNFMSIYAEEFQHINNLYQKNRINASEFIKRYKKLNKYIGIYKTPLDIYKNPMNRFDDFILESGKIYDTITKSAKSKIASNLKSGLQSKKRNDFQKDLEIIKQKLLNSIKVVQKPIEKVKKTVVITKRKNVNEYTIRNHLNSLSITKLKDLARIHNKLYRIKIGQTKDELIEALASQYEKMTGTHLIHKQPEELNLTIPKKVRKYKPKVKKEILEELVIEKEPIKTKDTYENTVAPQYLKDKLQKFRKEREAIQKIEEQNKIKFSYNSNFVDDDKIGQEQFKIMEKGQNRFDFYKTPQTIIDEITDSVISEFKKTKINILEPSAGIGSLITGIINRQNELNISNLDANEFNEEMYKLLIENFKISHIYNKNFLKWIPEIKYDCIIMNPPYEGYINEEVGRSKVAYLYHVMKAVLLGENKKTIYAVLPPLKHKNTSFEFENVISKIDMKRMKNEFNIDEIPVVKVELLMENINGWKKVVFSRGKFNLGNVGLSLNLYKFTVL